MGEREKKEEKCLRARLRCSDGDDFRGAVEGGDQPGDTDIDQQPDQLRDRDCTENAECGAPPGAVIFLRAQVLADEGGEGQ